MQCKLILITFFLTFLLPSIVWENNEPYPNGQLVEIKDFVRDGDGTMIIITPEYFGRRQIIGLLLLPPKIDN